MILSPRSFLFPFLTTLTLTALTAPGDQVEVVVGTAKYEPYPSTELSEYDLPAVDHGTPSVLNVIQVNLPLVDAPVEIEAPSQENLSLQLKIPMGWNAIPEPAPECRTVLSYSYETEEGETGTGEVILSWGWIPFQDGGVNAASWHLVFPNQTTDQKTVVKYFVHDIRAIELTRQQEPISAGSVSFGDLQLTLENVPTNLLPSPNRDELIVSP